MLAMLVLGIETSCDETGLAVYDSRAGLLSDILYSQVDLHADYGGGCSRAGIARSHPEDIAFDPRSIGASQQNSG